MKQRFLVVYEFAEGTYSGYAPDLPGCISSGGSHEEIRANMCEAVGNHVGLMITQGNEVPISVAHIVRCPKPVRETDVQHWIVERLDIEVPVSQEESGINECQT
jgi:predicted RNase H-like HicB family nuclease